MFTIRIAGIDIGIDNKYDFVKRICRDYIKDSERLKFTVSVDHSTIEAEAAERASPAAPGYAESLCIYREICRRMPEYSAYLLHAAVVECDGRAYAFAARSGTGKSTHASLWLKHLGSRARIINGDKPIVRFFEDGAYIYGTPWCGKEGYNINTRAPLSALCFIERADENKIRPAARREVTERLLGQILIPREPAEIARLMPLIDLTVRSIPCWVLSCNISLEAAEIAHMAMSGASGGVVTDENCYARISP